MRFSGLPGKLLVAGLLIGALTSSCNQQDDFKGMSIKDGTVTTSSGTSASSSLSGSVISELQSNLSSNSSSRQAAGRSFSTRSAALSNITLTTAQISAVATAATTAVQNSGMTDSVDLIQLLPKIIEGAQGSLSSMGLSSLETIKVIQVVVFSMPQSLNGRDAYLPSASAGSGATALETALSKVAESSISQLDEAGLSTSDIATPPVLWWEPWSAALMTGDLKSPS